MYRDTVRFRHRHKLARAKAATFPGPWPEPQEVPTCPAYAPAHASSTSPRGRRASRPASPLSQPTTVSERSTASSRLKTSLVSLDRQHSLPPRGLLHELVPEQSPGFRPGLFSLDRLRRRFGRSARVGGRLSASEPYFAVAKARGRYASNTDPTSS